MGRKNYKTIYQKCSQMTFDRRQLIEFSQTFLSVDQTHQLFYCCYLPSFQYKSQDVQSGCKWLSTRKIPLNSRNTHISQRYQVKSCEDLVKAFGVIQVVAGCWLLLDYLSSALAANFRRPDAGWLNIFYKLQFVLSILFASFLFYLVANATVVLFKACETVRKILEKATRDTHSHLLEAPEQTGEATGRHLGLPVHDVNFPSVWWTRRAQHYGCGWHRLRISKHAVLVRQTSRRRKVLPRPAPIRVPTVWLQPFVWLFWTLITRWSLVRNWRLLIQNEIKRVLCFQMSSASVRHQIPKGKEALYL